MRLWAAVLALAACDPTPGGATAREAAPPEEPAPEPAAAPATEPASAPADPGLPYGVGPVTLEQIGQAAPAWAPPADAAEANRQALEHHRAGRYEQSLAGFERAQAAAAGYPMARFNRACALARLDRLDEAAAEMTR